MLSLMMMMNRIDDDVLMLCVFACVVAVAIVSLVQKFLLFSTTCDFPQLFCDSCQLVWLGFGELSVDQLLTKACIPTYAAMSARLYMCEWFLFRQEECGEMRRRF